MSEKVKVALIGREVDLLEMVKGILEGEDYHVEALMVGTGKKGGFERLRDSCPDLVILDVSVLDLFGSGFEKTEEYALLEAVKACREMTEIPIIVVVGLNDVAKGAEKFLGSRFGAVIVKPFNVEDFLDVVKKVVSS